MQFNLDITSFNVNATEKENSDFKKYEIDVSLNEVTNNENSCLLKYGYTLNSIPKGIRLSFEGTIEINGNPSEIESTYKKDEQNIPPILRMSYHELYPVLFMITKSMKIPCPPYEIITTTQEFETSKEENEQLDSNTTNIEKNTDDNIEHISNEEEQEYKNFELMSTEKLTKLQIDLNKQNSDNPSDELQKQLDVINEVLNKKIKDSEISTQNVS